MKKIMMWGMALSSMCVALSAQAETFVVKNIQLRGLKRIESGTVYNALPIKVGDRFNTEETAEIIQALFDTGFFEDVHMDRLGATLTIRLQERPAIGQVVIVGNEDLTDKELKNTLKTLGLHEGYIFDPGILKKSIRELEEQYFSRGKYAVRVTSDVKVLDQNRVSITLNISEGKPAKIRSIQLVGAGSFPERLIKHDFEQSTPGMFTWLSHRDRYSKEKLAGDLERLRSFYMDRGYLKFKILSTQVAISANRENIFITINVSEGPQYHVREVTLGGTLIVPKEELLACIKVKKKELFVRKDVTETISEIQKRLGNEGYAFAEVIPTPELDEQEHVVDLNFEVQPGKRAYVHQIHFKGNMTTQDDVLRRAMVQFEGGWASTDKIQESRTNLLRTSFFSEVNVETERLPGQSDQVDVIYTVKEHPSGAITGGFSYAPEEGGVRLELGISQKNFLGTGNSVDVNFNNSQAVTSYSFSFTNPYYTPDGISRGFFVNYTKTDPGKINLSHYSTDRWGGGVNYGIPLTSTDVILSGLSYRNMRVKLPAGYNVQRDPQGVVVASEVTNFLGLYGHRYHLYNLSTSWRHSTLDKVIFPTRGLDSSVGVNWAVPGSRLQYYKLITEGRWYYSFNSDWVSMFKGVAEYGSGYGRDKSLPFFENFLAGGETSVRGFEPNTLGPRGTDGDALGGNIHLEGTVQLFFPNKILDPAAWRTGVFFDIGNVYHNHVDFSQMRSSAGVVAEWMSPLGSLVFGIARPIKRSPGDQIQPFVFSIGTAW